MEALEPWLSPCAVERPAIGSLRSAPCDRLPATDSLQLTPCDRPPAVWQPAGWVLPEGAMLLTPDTLDAYCPSDVTPLPCLLAAPVAALFAVPDPPPRAYNALLGGPMAASLLAAAVLLLLLLAEGALTTLVLVGLCQTPPEYPHRAQACAATLLVLPFANILAPLAGLTLLAPVAMKLRGTRSGRKLALETSSSGTLVRDLRIGALWNVASLPNTLVAQLCFVPLAQGETTDTLRATYLVLLPACLLVTKLLAAQAYKALGASVGLTDPVQSMLHKCEAHVRAKEAAALSGRE
jgi:hypothetical protein